MNYHEIIKEIQAFEAENNMKSFSINGVDMWPLIRFQLATKCFDSIDEKTVTIQGLWPRILVKAKLFLNKEFFSLVFSIIRKTDIPKKFNNKDFLFLSDESSKRISLNNVWVDVFMDSYIHRNNLLEKDFAILRSNQMAQLRKSSLYQDIDISPIVIKSFLKARLKTFYFKAPNNFVSTYNKISYFYKSQLMMGDMPSINNIIFEGLFISILASRFEIILSNIRPKKVVLSHYNGYISSAMTHASKNKGIPVSDIQHGVQGKLHPAYNFINFPKNGFSTIPDNFLVWNDCDADNIRSWGADHKINVEVIGNPSKYLFNSGHALESHYSNLFEKKYNNNLGKKLILISLCWGYFIPDLILNVLRKAPSDAFFLVRFHPMTTDSEKNIVLSKLYNLEKKNYEVEHASSLPLHLILSNISMHIAIVSTIIEEGLEYGIPTVAIGSRAKAYWGDTKNSKISFSDSFEDIINTIKTVNMR